jgi:hypothetical protein
MNFIKEHLKIILYIAIPVIVATITVLLLVLLIPKPTPAASVTKTDTRTAVTASAATATTVQVAGLQLDTSKNYGNKYADGILPVGDNDYSLTTPKVGTILLCHAPGGGEGGAGSRGPWFVNNNTEYDINKKLAVSGSVTWTGSYSMTLASGQRVIVTNDLPLNHTTGTFPIKSTDAAYLYDKNPNSIKSQSLTYTLTESPIQLSLPGCMGGESGVMTTGVALFDGFDAGGRDAGAWEVQDSCNGHPQVDGEYHYHTLSSCIKDVSVKTVIGYALDGYPITGPTISTGNVLTTDDLDECHGIVSQINLDGTLTTSYHYVMTEDFPYSVSCFRGTAINAPHA